jgi:hypothetical protein
MGLAACGAPSSVFVRKQVTWAEYRADRSHCFDQRRGKVPIEPQNADIPRNPTPVSNAASAGIITGFAEGWARAAAESRWADECMKRAGYTEVELTSEQRSRLAGMQSEEAKTDFIREFLIE